MRITGSRLRSYIRSIIKESYETSSNVFKKEINGNIEVVITNQGSDSSLPAAIKYKREGGISYNSFRIETINHYVKSLPTMDRTGLYSDKDKSWIVEESDGIYRLLEKIIKGIKSPNGNKCYPSHRYDADYFSIPEDLDPSDVANKILDQLVLPKKKIKLIDNKYLHITWNEENDYTYDNDNEGIITTFTLDISYNSDKIVGAEKALIKAIDEYEGEIIDDSEDHVVAEFKYKLSPSERIMPNIAASMCNAFIERRFRRERSKRRWAVRRRRSKK